jgi:signal transduction histidine kinase
MLTTILNMDIRELVLIIVAFCNFILAIFVFLKNKKDRINIYYSFTALATGCWTFGLAAFSLSIDLDVATFWCKFYYVSAALIASSFLAFSFVFPFDKRKLPKIYSSLFYLFTIFIIGISVWPGAMIKEIVIRPWGKEAILSPFYFIYTTYFVMCVIGAFGNFLRKHKQSLQNEVYKMQIKYVFIGTSIAMAWGMMFNLFLPLIGNYKLIWLGPYLSLAMIGFIAYAIFKHHLMNIKIITTELFGVLIMIVVLLDALMARSRIEFFLKFGLFMVVAVFSILLIRSVLNEVRSTEKVVKLAHHLEKANIELKKLDKAKSEFISIASHQLRTPVSVIKGVSSMMKEGDMEHFSKEKRERFIDSLWQKSCKLERIIKDILSATEMTSIKYKAEKEKAEPIDLEELLKESINDFQPAAQEREIELSLTVFGRPIPKIYGEAMYLRDAVDNLIDNALKYTPSLKTSSEVRGKRKKKGIVSVSLTKKENNVIISVKDNGIGIPPKEKANLFDKFTRASNARDMYTDGSGLGLFIAKEIVEGHQGKIWLESEFNKGTTFYISLPI